MPQPALQWVHCFLLSDLVLLWTVLVKLARTISATKPPLL
jgi:hypothetical protein